MWRATARVCCLGLFGFLLACPALAGQRYSTEEFNSAVLGGKRTIRVYLPASYFTSPQRRYPVLYLHDGQNVFSFAGTNIAFGWGNWGLDQSADALAKAGRMQEVILVGIDNSLARMSEYGGRHRGDQSESPTAFEKYDVFLRTELKPHIDGHYRTQAGPAGTTVLGSSMGGLCSLVMGWEHPEVFGGAASLSGAFMVEHTNFLNSVLRTARPPAKPVRLYLDSGIKDFMGGDDGCSLSSQVAAELRRLGWHDSKSGQLHRDPELMHFVDEHILTISELQTAGLRRDKWSEAQTSQHNEFYWRLRVWRALVFLFPAGSSPVR